MHRFCVLAALLVGATPAYAQTWPPGSPEAARDFARVAGRPEARRARIALTTPLYARAEGDESRREIVGGTEVLAYDSQTGRVAIATPTDGRLGWVSAAAVLIGTRDAPPPLAVAGIGGRTTPAAVRQSAIYDSLRTLPPSMLSERDLQWMTIYQNDRQTQTAQQQARSVDRTSKAVSGYLGFVVVTSILGVLAAVAVAAM